MFNQVWQWNGANIDDLTPQQASTALYELEVLSFGSKNVPQEIVEKLKKTAGKYVAILVSGSLDNIAEVFDKIIKQYQDKQTL